MREKKMKIKLTGENVTKYREKMKQEQNELTETIWVNDLKIIEMKQRKNTQKKYKHEQMK